MATLMRTVHLLTGHNPIFRCLAVVFLGLCLFDAPSAIGNNDQLFQNGGKMTPYDPLVQTGFTLNLTCTLNKAKTFNASQIYFSFNNEKIPASYVTVVDEVTAKLHYPNVSRALSGHWFCYLPSPGGTHDIHVGQQVVTVADPPVKPTITGCRVYNWKNMTCWWEPKIQDTGIKTTQQLYWSLLIYNTNPNYYHCPYVNSNSCTWKSLDGRNSFKFRRHYNMYVAASNKVMNVPSDLEQINTNHIVEPDPVKNLAVQDITKNSVLVKWTTPHENENILYRIKYNGLVKKVVFQGTQTNVLLENLRPYTHYTVVVDCSPADEDNSTRGFPSKNRTITFTTLESVPDAAPNLAPGGFEIKEDHRHQFRRSVDIYWKSIPREYRNGAIKEYRISYKASGESENYKFVIGSENQTTLTDFLYDKSYEISVNARTSLGFNETLSLPVMTISKNSSIPRKPRKFVTVIISSNLVQLNWTSVEGATSYTVYWCIGSADRRICNDELNWKQLTGNDTSYDLELSTERKTYIFGVSVEQSQREQRHRRSVGRNLISSGLKWTDCTYDASKDPAKPQDVHFADHQEGGTLTVEWSKPKCSSTGYIEHYEVMYCAASDCPGNDPSSYNIEHIKTVTVDAYTESTVYTLTLSEGIKETVMYNVWLRSISPFKPPSLNSEVIHRTVDRTGLASGYIAVIVICGLFSLFLIIFAIYSCITKCRKKMKEVQNIPIERPPEIRNNIPDKLPDCDDDEADYLRGYTSLLDANQCAIYTADGSGSNRVKENILNQRQDMPSTAQDPLARVIPADNSSPQPGYLVLDQLTTLEPKELIARVYMNGSDGSGRKGFRGKKGSGSAGQPDCSIDSVTSNDTVLTLLQHDASEDSLDEVFDSSKSGGGLNRSIPDHLRLTTVPEEGGREQGRSDSPKTGHYRPGSSSSGGTGHKFGSSIQEYSKFGLKDDEATDDEQHTYHSIDEPELEQEHGALQGQENRSKAPIVTVDDVKENLSENPCYKNAPQNSVTCDGNQVPNNVDMSKEDSRNEGGGYTTQINQTHPPNVPNGFRMSNGAPSVSGDMSAYTQVGHGSTVSKEPIDPIMNNNTKNNALMEAHKISPVHAVDTQGYKRIEDLLVKDHQGSLQPSNHDRPNKERSTDSSSYVLPNWTQQEVPALVPVTPHEPSYTGYLTTAQI